MYGLAYIYDYLLMSDKTTMNIKRSLGGNRILVFHITTTPHPTHIIMKNLFLLM